jgi:hypothetical protein
VLDGLATLLRGFRQMGWHSSVTMGPQDPNDPHQVPSK